MRDEQDSQRDVRSVSYGSVPIATACHARDMTSLAERIDSLDEELFAPSIEAQLNHWDRRSLLALHAAVAASRSPFTYL